MFAKKTMSGNKTFTIIKPDAFEAGYTGPIIQKIEEAGFNLKNMRLIRLDQESAGKFYAIHKEKPFFGRLCDYMCSGPIIVIQLEKENAGGQRVATALLYLNTPTEGGATSYPNLNGGRGYEIQA